MTLAEAKRIAANPSEHSDRLILARLKLGNSALRAFPSSPRQREIQQLVRQIEAMPRELWTYNPDRSSP